MRKIDELVKLLGDPYIIKKIDKGDSIYRKLDTGYEFEVNIISSNNCTLYVWDSNPRELVGIYKGITADSLKDALGYYAAKYRMLPSQFLVEREDREV